MKYRWLSTILKGKKFESNSQYIVTTLDIDEKSEASCYLLDYIVGARHTTYALR